MRRLMFVFLTGVMLSTGCRTLAPDYARPAAPVPEAWPAEAASGTPGEFEVVEWRQYFADPKLRSVVQLALDHNRDLRIAALNVDKAAALYRIQRGQLYPGVGVQAAAEVYRVPEKLSGADGPETVEQYSVNVGTASWEIDVFGRLRSLKAAALERFLATEQARSATQISLVAGVASSYLVLAADLEALELARATLQNQQSTLDLVQRTRDVGVTSGLEVRQARSQVESARAQIARYEGLVASDRHLLDMIVGAPVPADLLPQALGGVTEVSLAPGVPSDVLLRRPDILAAEGLLKAANANIGAARAAFFPTISLTAGLGSASADLTRLLQVGTGSWTIAPQLIAPIFAGGSLKANLAAARVDREIAVAEYEKAIQGAFREVSDALSLRATLVAQQQAQASLVTALEETYRLSEARYRAGMDGYLGVLVAQTALFNAQQALVSVRLAEQVNAVTLFKVLGGGV